MKSVDNWKALQPVMKEAILYASQKFGPYPYKQFSFVQGGDGGMEYPMATLVMGDQKPDWPYQCLCARDDAFLVSGSTRIQ